MKWMVRIGVVIFALFCGFKAIPEERVESGDSTSTTIRYVALGDSIAYGYGLEDREEQSYVSLVRKHLEKSYDYVIETNFGSNGMQSGDLLEILTNPEHEYYRQYRASLKYADVVTLSIGSNDLLHLVKLDFNMDEMIKNGKKMFIVVGRFSLKQGFVSSFIKSGSEYYAFIQDEEGHVGILFCLDAE